MKTVLITGANKSIGFETARQLARQGYFIYLGSRDMANGQAAVDKLKEEGLTNVQAIQLDVCDKTSIEDARSIIAKQTGSLDVLINNAGVLGGMSQSALTMNTADIRTVFDTNVYAPIDMIQAFIDLLRKSPEPRIVNVTSGLGSLTLHSDPAWKYYAVKTAAYGPSKTALNAYTVVLAYELRETPFKVNVVDPGYTATDFNHHNGPGTVESAATFVAKYATLPADGPTGRFFSNDYDENNNESPW